MGSLENTKSPEFILKGEKPKDISFIQDKDNLNTDSNITRLDNLKSSGLLKDNEYELSKDLLSKLKPEKKKYLFTIIEKFDIYNLDITKINKDNLIYLLNNIENSKLDKILNKIDNFNNLLGFINGSENINKTVTLISQTGILKVNFISELINSVSDTSKLNFLTENILDTKRMIDFIEGVNDLNKTISFINGVNDVGKIVSLVNGASKIEDIINIVNGVEVSKVNELVSLINNSKDIDLILKAINNVSNRIITYTINNFEASEWVKLV